MGHVEKLCRKHVLATRGATKHYRDLKKRTGKLVRRLGRLLLEDAPPKRPTRGYSD